MFHEKNISTQQPETVQNSWIFSPDEHCRRTKGDQQKAGQGKKKAFGLKDKPIPFHIADETSFFDQRRKDPETERFHSEILNRQ